MFAWDDLRHLLAFARNGSTLAAAKVLGVNQSTVHRRLAALEERLGRRLIERHLTGYRLTEFGHDLLPYAERVEEAVAAFERRSSASGTHLVGKIRLTCAPTVGERLKRTSLIETFETLYPGLQVELVMGDRFFDLSKGEADIAIRSRGGEPEDPSLFGRKLVDLTWALYGSCSYVDRYGQPRHVEDITGHRVIKCTGPLAVNFQEVVHSVQPRNSDVAKRQ
jgi:DNA-binding transcriptional LysR family regulator